MLRKWLAILPHPFTAADRAAGYRYDLSILQAEFSLTQMLDKPVSGRVFFEQVIRDNLDIGRPDQVSLVFDRRLMRRGPRPTPGRFRTRVITAGVTPSLHVDYKHTTHQAVPQGREGLTHRNHHQRHHATFGIGKRLTNLPACGRSASPPTGACCASNRLSHDPITGTDALARHHRRRSPPPPAPASPGCGSAEQRSHALLSALLAVPAATRTDSPTKTCARYTAELRGLDPGTVTAGQMTYDLRRLKTRGAHHPYPGHPPLHSSPITACDTAMFLTCRPRPRIPAHRPRRTRRPRHPPRAVCDPLPPHTAPRSKTSPRQHNSRNGTSTATTTLKHQRT